MMRELNGAEPSLTQCRDQKSKSWQWAPLSGCSMDKLTVTSRRLMTMTKVLDPSLMRFLNQITTCDGQAGVRAVLNRGSSCRHAVAGLCEGLIFSAQLEPSN